MTGKQKSRISYKLGYFISKKVDQEWVQNLGESTRRKNDTIRRFIDLAEMRRVFSVCPDLISLPVMPKIRCFIFSFMHGLKDSL